MTLELFADNPVVVGGAWSTLSAPYTAGATALAVASNTPYPAADPTANPATVFRVRVDNEILLVTDNRTLTWTVAGAQEGSTAANHASGVQVFVPFTKGSVAGVLAAASVDAAAKVATETTRATTAEAAAQAAAVAAAATDATTKANAAQAAAVAASQPLDSDLTAIAALTTTSFGRALLALADAAAGRTTFGLGTAATQASTAFDAAGLAAAAQAASQPLDSDLTAIAALTTTAYGRAFLALADAAAARTALALGTIATHDATEFLTTASAASAYAPLASPALTGTPIAPTQAAGDNSTRVSTTAYADAAVAAQHTTDTGLYVAKASNLSDLADAGTSRANLQVPTLLAAVVVATGNVTLSGTQTIDGVAVAAGDRVLAAGQTTTTQNGPWVVAAGAWTRPTDYAAGSVVKGRVIQVMAGTTNAGTMWVLLTSTSVTVGTTATLWQTVNKVSGSVLATVVSNAAQATTTSTAVVDLNPAIATPTFVADGTQVVIEWGVPGLNNATIGDGAWLQLTRNDGAAIDHVECVSAAASQTLPVGSVVSLDTPAAGVTTSYKLQLAAVTGGTAQIRNLGATGQNKIIVRHA